MGGMLLAGGHGASAASEIGMLPAGAHHTGVLSPHLMLAAAVGLYLAWSLAALARPAHVVGQSTASGATAPAPRAARCALAVERVGMAVMFAAAATGMAVG